MKKSILSLIMIMALVVTITSCKEEKKETTTSEEVTTETVEVEVTESEATTDTTEESTEVEVESTSTTSEGGTEVPEKDVLDEESVTITYAKMVNGMEVKAKKTFKGSQEKVEALVKAFEDSLKKVDPSIKIINE